MSVPLAYPFSGTYSFQRTICFAGHVPTSIEECAGNVVLGMIVCALSVYAPLCINAVTFTMSASAIASGRRPSKLTIKTRSMGGAGVGVNAGKAVSVADGGVLPGVRVAVGRETTIGGEEDAIDPHDCKRIVKSVKIQICRIMFGMILQSLFFVGDGILFTSFIIMDFLRGQAESFINRKTIPFQRDGEFQRISCGCGSIHCLDGGV